VLICVSESFSKYHCGIFTLSDVLLVIFVLDILDNEASKFTQSTDPNVSVPVTRAHGEETLFRVWKFVVENILPFWVLFFVVFSFRICSFQFRAVRPIKLFVRRFIEPGVVRFFHRLLSQRGWLGRGSSDMDQAVRLGEFRVGYGHGGVTVLEGLWMLFVEYLVLLVLM
jgi:hypothetical protein